MKIRAELIPRRGRFNKFQTWLYLFIHLSVCLLIRPLCLLICPSVCSFVCLFIHSFVMSAFSRLSVYSFVCLSIRPFVCLIIRFFVSIQSVCSRTQKRTQDFEVCQLSFKTFYISFLFVREKNKNNCSCNSTLKMSLFVLFCNHHIAISLRANLL